MQLDDTAHDRHLIDRLRARDHSAVSDLASRYSSRIRQLALRYVKNEEDAEEVVQDVLFKVYQKIEAFRGDSALSSWIYRITFNTAMSRLRSTRAGRDVGAARRRAGRQRRSAGARHCRLVVARRRRGDARRTAADAC